MQNSELSLLAPEVCQVVEFAGDAVMDIYGAGGSGAGLLSLKADDSPLTLADLAAHNAIVAGLKRLTPTIPVVSEEDPGSFAHRIASGSFWLIDPLDGTKEFLARTGDFTVNVALIEDAEPVWGVVYAPALEQMFWGGRTFGATRRTPEGEVSLRGLMSTTWESPCRVVASKSHLNERTEAFIQKLRQVDLVKAGSSLKFCRIAEGLADVYPRLAPTCEWDTAAAQAVLEGAGGHVYDTQGHRLCYGKADVLNPDFIAASMPFLELERLVC